MINVDETDLSLPEAIQRHAFIVRSMEDMVETTGWELIVKKLEQDIETQKSLMRRPGLTGEQALSICAGIVSAETILRSPEHLIATSNARIKQLQEQTDAEAVQPKHHREGQIRGRTVKTKPKDENR